MPGLQLVLFLSCEGKSNGEGKIIPPFRLGLKDEKSVTITNASKICMGKESAFYNRSMIIAAG